MKNILITICVAVAVTALFNTGLLVLRDRTTTWQYDGWRKSWREQQERIAREALEDRLWDETMRTNPPKNPTVWFTNANGVGIECWTMHIRNSSVLRMNQVYEPKFEPGSFELGYRRDGSVAWRVPPELHTNVVQRVVAKAKDLLK